jgi:hypothetical protein
MRFRPHPSPIALVCLAGASFAALATSRAPEPKNLPQIRLKEERLGPNGNNCNATLKMSENKGALPPGVQQVVRMHVFSDRPASWKELSGALKHRAGTFCAEGISYLKAEVSDGMPGYTDVHAVAWVHPAAPNLSAP